MESEFVRTGSARLDGLPPTLSLAQVGAVADMCSDGIILLAGTGEVVAWNSMAGRIVGQRINQIRGSSFDVVFGDQPSWRALLTRVLNGERAMGIHVDIDGAAGRRVPVRLALVPLREGRDDVAGFAVVMSDLSEQVVSQQTLADNEARVRRSEALALTGSFVLDANDQSEQWSDGMYQIHLADPERFVVSRENHLALVLEQDRDRVHEVFDRALAGEFPPGVDHRVRRMDGTVSHVFVAVEPRTDGHGRIVGLSGVCQDVNARVTSEQALQEALRREQSVSDELRRVDALKDEFLATVSHELRTPLTSIAGFAALLREEAPAQALLVDPIGRNADEMLRMIRRLLDQARLESGRVPLDPTPFPLANAVRTVLAQNAAVLGDTEVGVAVPEDLTIVMDRDGFSRVLGNLLANAATHAQGATIKVGAQSVEGAVIVSVADDGPGIPTEHQAHLFDPFFRVPGRASLGTGFGLAIARRYVEVHGGKIWCESTPGHGATFYFQVGSPRAAPQ